MVEAVSSRMEASRQRIAAERVAPKRVGNGWLTGITLAATLVFGFTLGMIPWVGGVVTHGIERVSNHFKAKRELDARADWYRNQIAATLGIDPTKVKGKHLVQAAAINPTLAAAVKDIRREEESENKSSMMINGAVSMIPGGVAIKEAAGAVKTIATSAKVVAGAVHTGKMLAVTTATGMLASWTTAEHLGAQEVIEGISGQLEAARAQGIDPRSMVTKVVTPQMVFMLRVAQDEALSKEIVQNFYKKPFNKLNEQEQAQVMQAYAPLANAAKSEAYAVVNNMMPVQELMAAKPNLNGTAQYRIGSQAATFAEREASRNLARGLAANDPQHVQQEEARRAAAQMANGRRA